MGHDGTLGETGLERIQVAHIGEQGLNLILVPLDALFRQRPEDDQRRIGAALQAWATTAGMDGVTVPVWDAGDGRMAFLAPVEAHPFLKAIDLAFVLDHLNAELSWSGLTGH